MLTNTKQTRSMLRRGLGAAGLALGLWAIAGGALAQRAGLGGYPEQSGQEIYTGVCQGCHMPGGKGAAGAGAYPALAGDKKLGAKLYPVMVVVRGQKAMPEFGSGFSDTQVANVVNYIRSNFGNTYADAVTPDDVKTMRPPAK